MYVQVYNITRSIDEPMYAYYYYFSLVNKIAFQIGIRSRPTIQYDMN